jgi:hypothetical protein
VFEAQTALASFTTFVTLENLLASLRTLRAFVVDVGVGPPAVSGGQGLRLGITSFDRDSGGGRRCAGLDGCVGGLGGRTCVTSGNVAGEWSGEGEERDEGE